MSQGKKLRILHVGNHTFPCIGGIEKVIWETATRQAANGHRVEVIVFNTCPRGTEKLSPLEKNSGITIHRVPSRGPTFYPIPPIRLFLKHTLDKDIIHVHGYGAWLDIMAWSGNKSRIRGKLVLTTHGGFYHTANRMIPKQIYEMIILPHTLRQIDGIIAISPSDKTFVENKGGKAHLIPNGVQEDFFQPFKSEKDPRSILFVGRLSKNKRVDNLIRAFAHAYQREPRARLHIVGADWEGLMPELKEIAKEEGVEDFVWFHGKMVDENLLALYRKSGIFASASEYEGFGISTIEAMASGCIPVLNKIPPFENFSASCKEVKLTNFDYPDEAGKLLYDMMNISSDELKKKRMRCRDFACGFGWNTIIEKQIHFYRSLII